MTDDRPKKKWVKREKVPYSDELADFIVQELYFHNLTKIFSIYEGLPARPTVYYWLDNKPDFAERCRQANNARGQVTLDEIEELADNVDQKNPNATKVAVQAKQWIVEKKLPWKYGDIRTIHQKTTIVKDEKPRISVEDLRNLSPDVRDALRRLTDMATANPPTKAIE